MSFRSYMDMLDQDQQQPQQTPGFKPLFEPNAPAPQTPQALQNQGWGDTLANVGKAFGHGAAQGISMNASDLAGDKFAPEFQKELDANSKQHPWANMAGNVAGTVGSFFVPGMAWAQGVKGVSAAGRLARSALYGSAAGGISAGNESLHNGGNFMDAAPMGAMVGGGLGAAGGLVGETVAPWAGQKLASAFTSAPETGGPSNAATKWASDKLYNSMRATGTTPDAILNETAHIPNAWVADHPKMGHAINDLNAVGGDGHFQFAQAAGERASPTERAARLANDAMNPPQTYGSRLAADLEAAQQGVGQQVNKFNAPVDGSMLGKELDGIATQFNATLDDPALTRIRELRGRLQDQHDPLQLHNDKRIFDRRLYGEMDHPADEAARGAIDRHLDFYYPGYDAANQKASALHMQQKAHELGMKKNPNMDELNPLFTKAQSQVPLVPGATDSIDAAFRGGVMDATNYGNGPMARETLISRTARAAQRNPEAEAGPLNLSNASIFAQGAGHGGLGGGATSLLAQMGGNALDKMFKPGEEHGKMLAKFLQMSGPEREAIMREVSARGDKVVDRSKLISDILKRGVRGVAAEAGSSYQGK